MGTAFADGFPILLTAQASLDDLNQRLNGAAHVGTAHVRPNMHISGCSAWEEDEIPSIVFLGPASSQARLYFVKPCSRGTIPTLDPKTAKRQADGAFLKVLRKFRSGVTL